MQMKKKFINLMVIVTMVFGFIVLTGCDSIGLEDYKKSKITDLQAYADAKGVYNYTDDNWLILQQIVKEGKQSIEDATNKGEVDTAVENAKSSISEIAKEEVTVEGISNLFDLTEQKEYWAGSIADDFEDDRVVVIMKKTTIYPELSLESFGLDNVESLHYSFLVPTNENPNFHQMLVIYLKAKGKDQVVLAINELNKLDFIKTASPEYIYGTQDD
jgi:hypothetical protein